LLVLLSQRRTKYGGDFLNGIQYGVDLSLKVRSKQERGIRRPSYPQGKDQFVYQGNARWHYFEEGESFRALPRRVQRQKQTSTLRFPTLGSLR
jgi:hypothetical protein